MSRLLLAGLCLVGASARAQERIEVPSRPWTQVRHVPLPGAAGAALVPRPGGGAIAPLAAPSGFALLSPRGEVERHWTTDFRPDDVWWVGSEAVHAIRGRNALLAYAVDGSLRGAVALADTPIGHAAVPGASEAVIAFGSATAVLSTRVRWDGAPIGSVVGASGWRPATSGPASDDRGGVWIGAGAGLVRVWPSRRDVALERGVRRLVTRAGGGLFALVEGALIALDADANPQGRSAIDATVVDLEGCPDGGVAALLQSTPPRVVRFDARANVRARFDVGHDALALSVGRDGAVLVAARDGTLSAHEPDGALRWRMNLAGPLRPPVVALSPGRVAVATERSEILVLELAARDEPR